MIETPSFDFHSDLAIFRRSYEKLPDDLCRVQLGDIEVTMADDPFWNKFANGWEPETERIYRSLVRPGAVVLDIGAWIGPTILFALACGASRIFALEPNPGSFATLQKLLALNPEIISRVNLQNIAVSNREQTVTMGLAQGEDDTSTSGLAGDDFEIEAVTLSSLLESCHPQRMDLVKIDIEGAEVLICEALEELGHNAGQCVHLSIHVPLFPDSADVPAFINATRAFRIYDDRGEYLDHLAFSGRILSPKTHPEWGTRHGNYFEVLLIAS